MGGLDAHEMTQLVDIRLILLFPLETAFDHKQNASDVDPNHHSLRYIEQKKKSITDFYYNVKLSMKSDFNSAYLLVS